MMSLDILRRGFIAVFYAGRTAPVKRIRAEHSRLIGYHDEIHSSSRSYFSDRRPYGFFFFFSQLRENQLYIFITFILVEYFGNIPYKMSLYTYFLQ